MSKVSKQWPETKKPHHLEKTAQTGKLTEFVDRLESDEQFNYKKLWPGRWISPTQIILLCLYENLTANYYLKK